jgi:hypothetical protein
MSIKAMDEVLSRWFRDGRFREQIRRDPEGALAGYDLTPVERERWLRLKRPSVTQNGISERLSRRRLSFRPWPEVNG